MYCKYLFMEMLKDSYSQKAFLFLEFCICFKEILILRIRMLMNTNLHKKGNSTYQGFTFLNFDVPV